MAREAVVAWAIRGVERKQITKGPAAVGKGATTMYISYALHYSSHENRRGTVVRAPWNTIRGRFLVMRNYVRYQGQAECKNRSQMHE